MEMSTKNRQVSDVGSISEISRMSHLRNVQQTRNDLDFQNASKQSPYLKTVYCVPCIVTVHPRQRFRKWIRDEYKWIGHYDGVVHDTDEIDYDNSIPGSFVSNLSNRIT